MINEYPVYCADATVGSAQLTQCGLYYRIRCKCRFPQKQVYRVYAVNEEQSVDLGICVPEGDAFVLNKLIPINRLGSGEYTFCAICAKDSFVPVNSNRPFAFLADIERGKFAVQNGVTGVMFKDRSVDQQDNDQNQECQNR